jgi:bacteriorhodopsin
MVLEIVHLQLEPVATVGERPETIWLAVGAILMALGALYFIARGARVDDPDARKFFVITSLIPAIAFASYLAMYQGFAAVVVDIVGRGETLIYWGRYVDWLFTTPLLLLDLGLLVQVDRDVLGGALMADAFMIVTGFVAALSAQPLFRFVWWGISTVAFLFVLYFLFVGFTRKAREMDPDIRQTFTRLRNLTIVLWAVYPVWWLVGTEGANVVGLSIETAGFMVLDVLAKVGFGLILLRSRSVLEKVPSEFPTTEAPTAD